MFNITCLITIYFSLFNYHLALSQPKIHAIFKGKDFNVDSTSIYLFCRGTTSKSKLIAHKFNYIDTNITHVGIGYFESGGFKIYNVIDQADKNLSCLVIDSIESFVYSEEVYYLSIWEYQADLCIVKKLKSICQEFNQNKIFFDISFLINDDDTLYCSEFCVRVLNKIDSERFNYHTRNIVLDNLIYEKILKRRVLEYFPVDFFQKDRNMKKIYECVFK